MAELLLENTSSNGEELTISEEEQYRQQRYFEWLAEEERYKQEKYFEWLGEHERQQEEARQMRARMEKGCVHPSMRIETPTRQTAAEALIDGIRVQRFAQPALKAFFSAEKAEFLDEFIDYCKTGPEGDDIERIDLVRAYTNTGLLINVRQAKGLPVDHEDSYLVAIHDMEHFRITRPRVNHVEAVSQNPFELAGIKLTLTTDRFDSLDGDPPFDDADPLTSLMQLNQAVQGRNFRHNLQSHLTLSTQRQAYKPFRGVEVCAYDIEQVARDRYMLSRLARAAGWAMETDDPHELISLDMQRLAV